MFSDLGWTEFITREEAWAEEACLQCAQAAGYSPDEAELCEDADLNCPNCPFK